MRGIAFSGRESWFGGCICTRQPIAILSQPIRAARARRRRTPRTGARIIRTPNESQLANGLHDVTTDSPSQTGIDAR